MEDERKNQYEDMPTAQGKDVLPLLAEIYPQLYLCPGEGSAEACGRIVQYGEAAPARDLSHFLGDGRDSCAIEETPAGYVQVITLHQRPDFERFLQIMAFRCREKEIPATQGASILDGVINWTKIRAHRESFLASGGSAEDWPAEFRRFTADKRNYTDALIVLSDGPYSAVSAERMGMEEQAWLACSHEIRKAHECTHFICRRLFPGKIDAVWDEIVADAVGLFAAFGRYDVRTAALFLGVSRDGYTGGRLENYVSEEGEEKEKTLDLAAKKVYSVLCRLQDVIASCGVAEPYPLAIRLEEEIECWKTH